MDGQKISQLALLQQLSGNEDAVIAINGQNFRFKLSQVRQLVRKEDVGLGNVDNTSDLNKPVSTATAQALAGKANTNHNHAVSDVTGLVDALAGKSNTDHHHGIDTVDGLQSALDNKTNLDHHHDLNQIDGLQTALDGKAASSHSHSMNDVNNLVPTIQGLTTGLSQKAPLMHQHDPSEISGLDQHIVDVVQSAGISGDVVVGQLDW